MLKGQRKPANNIRELVNNLMVEALTKEQANFYVPIYDEQLRMIRDTLIFEEAPNQTIYVLGQKGSGKTTALNFLPDDELAEEFEIITLHANELFEIHDLNIAEILLTICNELIKREGSLKRKFRTQLERIKGYVDGTRTEEDIKTDKISIEGGLGGAAKVTMNPILKFLNLLNSEINLFANLRASRDARKIVREAFNASPREMFELTNTIIQEFRLKRKNKQLLLIINELDHSRTWKSIYQLFIKDRYYLEQLACRKVMSVPLALDNEGEFTETLTCSIFYMGLKMSLNPFKQPEEQTEAQTTVARNFSCLKEIINKRIANGQQLINDEAIEEAIKYSGGILRQYMSIIVNAARRVRLQRGTKISMSDIEHGISHAREDMEGPLRRGKELIDLLDQVRERNNPAQEGGDLLVSAFLANQIIAYRNKPTWYEINPLIEETIRIYAANRAQTSD